jgi:hypothetical protein
MNPFFVFVDERGDKSILCLVRTHKKWDEPLTNEAHCHFFFFFSPPPLSLSSRPQQPLETGASVAAPSASTAQPASAAIAPRK